MSEFTEGDQVVVFYFNSTSGKPSEMRLRVSDVTREGYLLERVLGDTEYWFEDGDFYIVEGSSGKRQLSTDAELSEPRE